jgi:hypothetical protein
LKYADLFISLPKDGKEIPEPRGAGVTLSFQMQERFEGHVDTLAEQAKAKGANVVSGPLDRLWNVRETTILNPDGYRLVLTSPININFGFDKRIEKVTMAQENKKKGDQVGQHTSYTWMLAKC